MFIARSQNSDRAKTIFILRTPPPRKRSAPLLLGKIGSNIQIWLLKRRWIYCFFASPERGGGTPQAWRRGYTIISNILHSLNSKFVMLRLNSIHRVLNTAIVQFNIKNTLKPTNKIFVCGLNFTFSISTFTTPHL